MSVVLIMFSWLSIKGRIGRYIDGLGRFIPDSGGLRENNEGTKNANKWSNDSHRTGPKNSFI
jgi:hypothetical protein